MSLNDTPSFSVTISAAVLEEVGGVMSEEDAGIGSANDATDKDDAPVARDVIGDGGGDKDERFKGNPGTCPV